MKFTNKTSSKSLYGRRVSGYSNDKSGKVIGYKEPNGKISDIAVLPTIKFSALKTGGDFHVRKDCIKENLRVREQSSTILFLVDSSGSMGVERQMVHVKTLIYSLLIDAYQKRDRVGMITFRATEAKLLLPFTNSVHIAKKKLENLETGGKTPLAHGFKLSFEVLRQEKNKNPFSHYILIIVSDGRGNVPFNGKNCLDQAELYGVYIKKLGIKTLILDTEVDHLAFGYSWELARLMEGKYMKLDDLNAENLQEVIYSI